MNRLESRSLVERHAHETDRRVKFVMLSSRGRKLRAELLDHVYQPPEVLSALSDADLRTLHQLSALLRPDAS